MQAIFIQTTETGCVQVKGKLQKNKTIANGREEKKREPGQKQQFSPLRIYIFMFAYTYVKKNVFTFNSYLPPTE